MLRLLHRQTFSPSHLANRFRLVQDFKAGKTRLSGRPSILYLESTNRCNLKCVMCPRGRMQREEVDMDPAVFARIMEQIDPSTLEMVVLHSDGEPLLNEALFEIIAMAKARGLTVMTSTNATLLDQAKARALVDSGLDILTISLDGITPEVYESIRRGGSFDKVAANIDGFLRLKGRKPPFVALQMIEMKENSHQAGDFAAWCAKYKPMWTHPVIKPMTDWFNEHDEIIEAYNFCDRPWFGMVVQSSGHIVPCVHDFDRTYPVGRVQDTGIYEAWNNEAMQALRQSILKGRRTNELCANCNATPPKRHTPLTRLALTCLDMGSVAKILTRTGYNRPRQY